MCSCIACASGTSPKGFSWPQMISVGTSPMRAQAVVAQEVALARLHVLQAQQVVDVLDELGLVVDAVAHLDELVGDVALGWCISSFEPRRG